MYLSLRVSVASAGLIAVATLFAGGHAQAGAVIGNSLSNPNVFLGINDAGNLNFADLNFPISNSSRVGLSYRFPDGTIRDSTSPGCFCEGWGVALTDPNGIRHAGFANEDSGSGGLTGGVFGATPISASSSLSMLNLPVSITHRYGISLVPTVFQGNVTITNEGNEKLTDLVYRRTMDWDVPPTEFTEYVSHAGVTANLVANGGNLFYASNNGFATSSPTAGPSYLSLDSVNQDFNQIGPSDQGSLFDFSFGDLDPGQSRSFNIFYGVAANLNAAKEAVIKLGADIVSLAQSTLNLGGGCPLDCPPPSGGGDATLPIGMGSPDAGLFLLRAIGLSPEPANDAPTFLFGFNSVNGVEDGFTPTTPLLPFVPADTVYEFPAPPPRRWFDPPYVSGFEYTLGSGEFLSFMLPPGFSGLTLHVDGSTFTGLTSGVEYFFAGDFAKTGVSKFIVDGIAPKVDMGVAAPFPIFLDFTPGAGTLMMKGLGATYEVPAPLPIFGLGVALGYRRRLRAIRQRMK